MTPKPPASRNPDLKPVWTPIYRDHVAETNAELVLVLGSRVVNRLFEILDLGRVITVVDELPDYLTPS